MTVKYHFNVYRSFAQLLHVVDWCTGFAPYATQKGILLLIQHCGSVSCVKMPPGGLQHGRLAGQEQGSHQRHRGAAAPGLQGTTCVPVLLGTQGRSVDHLCSVLIDTGDKSPQFGYMLVS